MTSHGPMHGETRNIGLRGALISCEYPLPLHGNVCVVIDIPKATRLVINAIVARSPIAAKAYVMKVPNRPAIAFDTRTGPKTIRTSDGQTTSEVALYFADMNHEELRLLRHEIAKRRQRLLRAKRNARTGMRR